MSQPQSASVPAHPRHIRLARRLIEVARAEAWPQGHRVTETDAAKRLAVSRTPARAALRLLVELGAMETDRGPGFRLARRGDDMAGMVPSVPDPPDAQIRAALIRDRLSGAIPVTNSQSDLSKRYACGLPTLQRVLGRLEQEGLASHENWQWTLAETLDGIHSRQASYQLRLILEPAALLLPTFKINQPALHSLIDEHERLLAQPPDEWDDMQIFDLDSRVHETLAGLSGNPFILSAVRQQNGLRKFLEVGSYNDRSRVAAWCREHQDIMKALLLHDARTASLRLSEHLTNAAKAAGL